MGCCSQTTHSYWWADQSGNSTTSQGRAVGIDDELDAATGQWYLYSGLRQGAMEYKANHARYQAGRMGRSRFLNVDSADVLMFERLHGLDFTLLGASNSVGLDMLLKPAVLYEAFLPSGITERMLRVEDSERSGDIIGADPTKLAQALPISEDAAKSWILSLRSEIGFGNSIVMVSDTVIAPSESGKVEVFDFAMLHGVTPSMEDALLEAKIHSSADFLAAGSSHLATVLNKPATVTADLIDELEHYLSEKGEKKKIRNA